MYRIVCESYENYKKDFLPDHTGDYRFILSMPLQLMVDLSLYKKEKEAQTLIYRKLEHLVFLLWENIDKYPRFKSLLWSLEARGIDGRDYGVLSNEEFTELCKIISMFLRLSYWN